MKKTIIALCVIFTLMISVGLVVAGKQTKTENGDTYRHLIKSNNGMLKIMYGVQHNFDKGFTTDLTPGQLKVLERFGVEVEKVELYQILGKPVCGNGIIEGGEKCGEPELPGCPEGYVCENCKCVEETTLPTRTCEPSTQTPWGIEKVNGGSGGAGINVAVLDTGVYKDHLDLDVKLCKDTTKRGIKNGCSDGNGHGTHVAGTIAANGGGDSLGILGVAPEANLWMVKVCGPSGCWTDDIAEAIIYVTNQGAHIISMSLGGDTQSSLIKDAIDYATENGVLVIAAAGNDGPADGSIDYPGANIKVIAVGAIDINEAIPYWSSRGVNDGDYIIEEREVEFGAPGVSVESTWKNGCYNTIGGTSMATPHVAGMAASLWQGSADTTRIYLQNLAKNHDLYTTGDDTATGFGLPIAP
ncbi:S8 family peptidase [Candidatus Pacearchaeota archaeon]|nr:S8 family peptidase [Candidatus Pacearchaeota archaeon]